MGPGLYGAFCQEGSNTGSPSLMSFFVRLIVSSSRSATLSDGGEHDVTERGRSGPVPFSLCLLLSLSFDNPLRLGQPKTFRGGAGSSARRTASNTCIRWVATDHDHDALIRIGTRLLGGGSILSSGRRSQAGTRMAA